MPILADLWAEGEQMMNIKISPLLWRYMILRFLSNFIFMSLILLGLILFFDVIELLRRATKFEDVPFTRILQMSLLKLPELLETISPFIILFSAMFTFWQFNRRYETTIFRTSGYSIWQFAGPILTAVIIIGFLMTTLLNPVKTVLIKKFNTLEANYLSKGEPQISLLQNGLWLRQPSENGYLIMHAKRLNVANWHLQEVMTLFFNMDDSFQWRIDAPKAILDDGSWEFDNAALSRANSPTQEGLKMRVETALTANKIQDSFSDPDTLSFWSLPRHINTLQSTGFDPASLKVHYQSLWARPFLFAALVLIAACVSLRPPRTQATFGLIVLGVSAGFAIFFVTNFLQALGASHQIGIAVAAWSPIVITFLFGTGVILSLEDG